MISNLIIFPEILETNSLNPHETIIAKVLSLYKWQNSKIPNKQKTKT